MVLKFNESCHQANFNPAIDFLIAIEQGWLRAILFGAIMVLRQIKLGEQQKLKLSLYLKSI